MVNFSSIIPQMHSIQKFFSFLLPVTIALSVAVSSMGQKTFTHQDTLRGSIGSGRVHWNILHYNLTVEPDIINKTISGINIITYLDFPSGQDLQIDLQEPMIIDSILYLNSPVSFHRDGNVYWVKKPGIRHKNSIKKIKIYFHGKPREAVNPPRDGGWIWKKDDAGNPFVSVACQGLGASVWYPCKDNQEDEPDKGCQLNIIVPDTLSAIGNGRLKKISFLKNHLKKCVWEVKNPINNYNIVPYIGKYSHNRKYYNGIKGKLSMDYYILKGNKAKARIQFRDAAKMMKAFEYWFGPYPFYEDGYKLVEAPHLGMEHQSAVAYGNHFKKGYLGLDRSGTGWGMKWDFIIIHESGHEWFGNNITAKDIADMWIHESFTNYSEALFVAYYYGRYAADQYVQGLRKNIQNDKPIIGNYGVNEEGSGDMYDKGGNMIHMIRKIIDNDHKFRAILNGMNKKYYHKTVTTRQIENYISRQSGLDCSKIFDQYLRDTRIPVLNYSHGGGKEISFWWSNCTDGFNMPVKISINKGKSFWIRPGTSPKNIRCNSTKLDSLEADSNFYIQTHRFIP